ncbi:hypothetical protein BH11ARM2_BH11ARM2_08090 [soil metagenome]
MKPSETTEKSWGRAPVIGFLLIVCLLESGWILAQGPGVPVSEEGVFFS